MKKLLILFFIPFLGWAQQYKVPVPKDVTNTPIYGGLGKPIAVTKTVTATTYAADYITLDQAGINAGRNYASLYLSNPSTSRIVYACFGDDNGCSGDAAKLDTSVSMIMDSLLMGPQNNITRIYFKLDGAGSVDVEVGYW